MSTVTPNMSLIIPTIGMDVGPDYANDINTSLSTIDVHDHSTGKGNPILPSSININSDLTFVNNSATNLKSLQFNAQSASPASASIWVEGVDLFFTDGNGADIRITTGGGLAGTPGTISGLVSPASAALSGSNFVWKQTASLYANMEFESAVLHNTTNANTVTLSSPTAPATSYGIVLPALPSTQKIMTLDASGNMAAPYTVDGSTVTINGSSQIAVGSITSGNIPNGLITDSKLASKTITNASIADGTITATQIASGTVSGTQITTNPSLNGNLTTTGTILSGGSVFVANSTSRRATSAISTSNFNIAAARVTAAGALSGTTAGMSSASYSAGTGAYTINFSSAFAANPIVSVTPIVTGTNGVMGIVTSVGTAGVSVKIVDSVGNSTNAFDFFITVIGAF